MVDNPFVRLEPVADQVEVSALVVALHSSTDAGAAAQIVAEHLVGSLQHERVATFDADEVMDFHRNRPLIVYRDKRFTDMHTNQLVIDLVRDDEGTELLLLHGQEPDLRWNRFTSEVLALAKKFGVERIYVVQGFPAGIPHTRPVQLAAHASNPELLSDDEGIMGTLQFPAQMSNVLEFAFGEAGTETIGYSAAIPHYLAHHPYPAAAAALVRRVAHTGGFALPVGELDAAAARFESELAGAVADDAAQQIRALETQFDTLRESQPQLFAADDPGGGDEMRIPTADEIGAAAEAFLADLSDSDSDRDRRRGEDRDQRSEDDGEQGGDS
ncbi:MAG TPA: PAC2 family protein [Actinomycetaceae bacterium]|nr:PAC2 family protein [Actinomycetaceae bacterium]